ncbi:MAG TPA: DUF4233 domain-containing protein [Nocardioidaceae bacterium]|nr:DUF4233 domain-containing protein [Nocardioidaceae bacterium]
MTRSMRRSLCAAMLVLQAVVLFLSGVVFIGVTDLGAATSLAIGAGLAVLSVVAAGMLGRAGGYALGWAVQVVSIGLGFVVTAMFVLGLLFAALWAASYVLGGRIDLERAERAVAEREWRAQHTPEHGPDDGVDA